MAYDQSTKDSVRSAYIYKCLDLKDCSTLYSVPYNTVRAWKKQAVNDGDCWDKARSAARISEGGLSEVSAQMIENFALQSQSLMQILSDKESAICAKDKVDIMAKLADAHAKLVASVKKSGGTLAPLAVAFEVIELLTTFIKEHFPQHAVVFIEIIEPFGPYLAKKMTS